MHNNRSEHIFADLLIPIPKYIHKRHTYPMAFKSEARYVPVGTNTL